MKKIGCLLLLMGLVGCDGPHYFVSCPPTAKVNGRTIPYFGADNVNIYNTPTCEYMDDKQHYASIPAPESK